MAGIGRLASNGWHRTTCTDSSAATFRSIIRAMQIALYVGSLYLACHEQALCLKLFVFRLLVDALLLQPAQLLFREGVRQLALEQRLQQQLLVGRRVHAVLGLVTSPIHTPPKWLKKITIQEKCEWGMKRGGGAKGVGETSDRARAHFIFNCWLPTLAWAIKCTAPLTPHPSPMRETVSQRVWQMQRNKKCLGCMYFYVAGEIHILRSRSYLVDPVVLNLLERLPPLQATLQVAGCQVVLQKQKVHHAMPRRGRFIRFARQGLSEATPREWSWVDNWFFGLCLLGALSESTAGSFRGIR